MSNRRPEVRARAITAALLALIAAAGAATIPAEAGAADEPRMSRETQRAAAQARRDAVNAERRQQREAVATAREERVAACRRIADWLAIDVADTIPPAVLASRFGGGRPGGAAAAIPYESWLLQDARFAPTFGARYDELPPAEQQHLRDAGNNCVAPRNDRGQAIADNMLFYRAFTEPHHARYVQGVARIREAHARVDAAMRDLQGLTGDDDGAKRYREHAARQEELGALLAASRRTAYQQAFADAYQRALLPWHAQRLRQAAAGAQGYEGLLALSELQAQMQRDARVGAGTAALPPEVQARQAALARALVAQERTQIDALGSGAAGLVRGVQWHEQATRRYGPLGSAQSELGAMFAYFETRRGALLDAAQPELMRLIARTRDEGELGRLVASHFPLEIDRARPSGAALLEQVALQRDELHKRSILGGGDTAPRASGGAAPAPAAGSPGEPSESEMYDAFHARLRAINDGARETAEHCNQREFNRGQGDPVLALQCLQFGLGVGVTSNGQNVGAPQFQVSNFRKIACEKAQGQAGYQCDFVAGMAGNLNLPPSLAGLMRNGEMAQARFVRQEAGWLLIPPRD